MYEFKQLTDSLYSIEKDKKKITLELEGTTNSQVINSFNKFLIYIKFPDNSLEKIDEIENNVKEDFGKDNVKSVVLKNTKVGLFKLNQTKKMVKLEYINKEKKQDIYTNIKKNKKVKCTIKLNYIWNYNDNHGFNWSIDRIEEI